MSGCSTRFRLGLSTFGNESSNWAQWHITGHLTSQFTGRTPPTGHGPASANARPPELHAGISVGSVYALGIASEPNPQTRLADGVGVQRIESPTGSAAAKGDLSSHTKRRLPTAPILSAGRRVTAWLVLIVGLPLLIAAMSLVRPHPRVVVALLLTLTLTVVVAAIGGLRPGLIASIVGAGAVNWWFIPPYRTLDIHDAADTVSIGVFVLLGIVVATLVDRVTTGAAAAEKSRAAALALSRMATAVATDVDPLPHLIDAARQALHLESVALFERSTDGGWNLLASSGDNPPTKVADGMAHPVDDSARRVLVLQGRSLNSNDESMLDGIADQIAVALDAVRLRLDRSQAQILEQVDELRTSILHAVSHDLRTPLTAIKASVSSLLSPEVDFDPEDTTALLKTIDSSVDRLDRVVGDLLDMSRLQSGVLPLNLEPTPVVELIHEAAASVGLDPSRYRVRVLGDLAPVMVDGALMERALGNILANADRVEPLSRQLIIDVTSGEDSVEIEVRDHGPGIPQIDRAGALHAFQRLGDRSSHHGVGLGLAIADGLTKANGGTLKLTGTPGGGLSVGFTLPIAKHPTSQLQSTEHQSTEHQASSHTPGPASTPSDSM